MISIPDIDINVDRIIQLQQEDITLKKYRDELERDESEKTLKHDSCIIENGVLYRRSKHTNPEDHAMQLLVPMPFRRHVLEVAHSNSLDGHFGIRKTTDKILSEFFWPSVIKEVKSYVRNCEECQRRTSSKEVINRELIGKVRKKGGQDYDAKARKRKLDQDKNAVLMKLNNAKETIEAHVTASIATVIEDSVDGDREQMIDKIMDCPHPLNKKQVKSFLGCVNYYRDYIPNCSEIMSPLNELTKKHNPYTVKWEREHEDAFVKLKEHLETTPILSLPDFQKPFILQTNASSLALGATLVQERDGMKFPIAYASRKLLEREVNYAVQENECLAIVWGIKNI